jgi:PIN domain nuclease of toxin-antitoxin system
VKLLLDTHAWLWMVAEPERFSDAARALLEDLENELLLSAACSWEVALKYALGKISLPAPPALYVPAQIERTGVVPLPVEHAHALRVAELPLHHRDPFDRILVAQAQLEDAAVLTRDRGFAAYDVAIHWAG